MRTVIILSALLVGALAGPLECPYIEMDPIYCHNDADCTVHQAQSYCKLDNLLAGSCVSTTYECPAGRECFKNNGVYSCKVPDGGSCTYNSQCAIDQKCINGKCDCPDILDFRSNLCIPNYDTYCAPQNRTCIPVPDFPPPYGSCISLNYQPSNNDEDCYGGTDAFTKTTTSRYHCTCRQKNNMNLCKHYTVLKKAMNDFKSCITPFLNSCATNNYEACCNSASSICKVILNNNAVSQYYPNMGDTVASDINYLISGGYDCGFKSIMSNRCDINLLGVY